MCVRDKDLVAMAKSEGFEGNVNFSKGKSSILYDTLLFSMEQFNLNKKGHYFFRCIYQPDQQDLLQAKCA